MLVVAATADGCVCMCACVPVHVCMCLHVCMYFVVPLGFMYDCDMRSVRSVRHNLFADHDRHRYIYG